MKITASERIFEKKNHIFRQILRNLVKFGRISDKIFSKNFLEAIVVIKQNLKWTLVQQQKTN